MSTTQSTQSTQSVFDTWSEYMAKVIDAEASLAGELTSHATRLGNEREAIIKKILARVIPDIYEIGSGQVVDANHSLSKQIDIIIARKDLPIIRFNDGTANYLAESVIAAIEVKSSLFKEDLELALDNVNSVTRLEYFFDEESHTRMCAEHEVSRETNGALVGEPKSVQRVLAATRPATYIIGLRGWKESDKFYATIEKWIRDKGPRVGLRDVPSLVVYGKGESPGLGDGCFAWRNDDLETYSFPDKTGAIIEKTPGLLLGEDPGTLRLLILHILRTLQRVAPVHRAASGLSLTTRDYLKRTRPFLGAKRMMLWFESQQ